MATDETPGDDSTLTSDRRIAAREAEPVGRFELLGLIGRGGMGEVFEARDRLFGRIVAIKRITGEMSPARRQRFDLEAQVTGQLDHAGIPPVYDRGVLPDGSPFYAMKRIRGRPLSEVIAACDGLETRLRLVPVVAQVARTIGFAHEHGVLHRDIKPANVIVSDHGEVVLLDWGLAQLRNDGASDSDPRATTGDVLGTPAYMAPEQAQGAAARIDVHTDVFSIGALLYHVLTGAPPYGDPTDGPALLRAAEGRFVPVRQRLPEVPQLLAEICERAMASDPSQRQVRAIDIAIELESASAAALRHRMGRIDWLTTGIVSAVILAAVVSGVAEMLDQVSLRRQGPGQILLGSSAVVGMVLLFVELRTSGRLRLANLVVALALATPMFAVARFASGLARTAALSSIEPGPDYLRMMLEGVAESAGGLVTGAVLSGILLLMWGAVRWRLARHAP